MTACLVLAGALSVGCGDDESAMTACESAATELCERACECGSCTLAWGDDGSQLDFDDLAGCLGLSRTLGCGEDGQGTAGHDYAGCEAALQGAMCVPREDNMGNPIMALESPAACR